MKLEQPRYRDGFESSFNESHICACRKLSSQISWIMSSMQSSKCILEYWNLNRGVMSTNSLCHIHVI